MQKNVTMYRLEETRGQDIRQIIRDTVREHGTITAAAEALNVTRQTLHGWIGLLDGRTETRLESRTEVVFDNWTPVPTSPEAIPA